MGDVLEPNHHPAFTVRTGFVEELDSVMIVKNGAVVAYWNEPGGLVPNSPDCLVQCLEVAYLGNSNRGRRCIAGIAADG